MEFTTLELICLIIGSMALGAFFGMLAVALVSAGVRADLEAEVMELKDKLNKRCG